MIFWISLTFPFKLLIDLSFSHSFSISEINLAPFLEIESENFCFEMSLLIYRFLVSLVKIFKVSIVFLTFFYYQESEVCKTVIETWVIKSKFWPKAFSKLEFFWDDFTRELKISMARSRWWFDLLYFFLSAFASMPRSSKESLLETSLLDSISPDLEFGKRYLKSGLIKLFPKSELHCSKI